MHLDSSSARGRMEISNPEASASSATGSRGRKRKRGVQDRQATLSRWKTDKEQQMYSSKLLSALRRVRSPTPNQTSPPRSRAVRNAADRALAAAARGRTRWSRAILSGRKILLKVHRVKAAGGVSRPRKSAGSARKERSPPAIERKARVLGRLVPGCRKLSLPTLLDEASDYIAALEMQVRTMSVLADILSSSTIGGSPPPPA